jgi:uncharacterized protein
MAKQPRQPSLWQTFRQLEFATQGVTIGLLAISLGVAGWFVRDLWERSRTHNLILVAGNPTGESYILAKAIETVVEAKVPRVTIEVQETKGTSENLARLAGTQETGKKADLATAQADVPAGDQARIVAVLYADNFQVIVQGKSTLQKFTDLKGKRIGLPSSGGQYKSFIQIAEHFGLKENDFTFIGSDDQAADTAFERGQVDAVFRVRAIGNTQIANLIQNHEGRLIPIEQAEAMRVKHPAFEPAKLPKGAYKGGEPTVPTEELATLNVQRLLLANASLDPDLVRQITQVLNENRRDLQAAIPATVSNATPLVSSIRRPETTGGTGIPIHPGALAYYDRDEPTFLQKNADYVALILTVILLLGSWLWELKRWMERRSKDIADRYIEQLIDVMNQCQTAAISSQEALAQIDRLFENVATELVKEGISQESFRTFNEAYKTVREVIDRKSAAIKSIAPRH